jgi:hypothetical protein
MRVVGTIAPHFGPSSPRKGGRRNIGGRSLPGFENTKRSSASVSCGLIRTVQMPRSAINLTMRNPPTPICTNHPQIGVPWLTGADRGPSLPSPRRGRGGPRDRGVKPSLPRRRALAPLAQQSACAHPAASSSRSRTPLCQSYACVAP